MHRAIYSSFAILVTAFLAASSCGGKKAKTKQLGDSGNPNDDRVLVMQGDVPDGLTLRLSDAKDSRYKPVVSKPAAAEKLPDASADALLARMPGLRAQAGDRKDFALRERSQPPPRTGDTVKTQFPPPAGTGLAGTAPTATSQSGGALQVLRYAPEGEVPLVPRLSVTFSQPMVAVTSHDDTVKGGVPVTLTPTPKGKWRWVGTRTLLFDPDPRFPQATEYKVEIPAGTKSANGGVLAEAKTWTFTTPAPRVKQSYPTSGPQRRDPALFVAFDQQIEPAAVLATIKLKAGGESYPVRALTDAEIAASAAIKNLIDGAERNEQAGRYVAFRTDALLPADAAVAVEIGPGTPSLEGPRVTSSPQSYSFRTYAPLKIEESRCSWSQRCPPLNPWSIRFNNPIDTEKFDEKSVRIKPELLGMRIDVRGRYMTIRGRTKGRTTYTVTMPASVPDQFDQTLGEAEDLTFNVGNADPNFRGPYGLVVLDPVAKKKSLDVFSINYKEIDVQLYRVTPKDWDAYGEFARSPYDNKDKLKTPPGKKIADATIAISGQPDEMVETAIPLDAALDNGLGHVIVLATPSPWTERWRRPLVNVWVQSTKIGLDAYVDNQELVAFASDLQDGKGLSEIALDIAPYGTKGRTDGQGLARIPLSRDSRTGRNMLLASRGQDVAFLPESTSWWNRHGGWYARDAGESLQWYVFDDRQMYRPDEEVHLKGWIRRIDNREGGDIRPLAGKNAEVSYRVLGSQGNEITAGKTPLNALGGFHLNFKLPKTPNLGYASVRLEVAGVTDARRTSYNHRFQIQEFRRPEFEVSVSASQGPHVVGDSADVTVNASYYAGGGLQGAEVNWNLSSSPGSFSPPNRDEYTFGTWTPWWGWGRWGNSSSTRNQSFQHKGKTDATGKHLLRADFVSVKPPKPMTVIASATVMDVNRQAWNARTTMLVHPADLYVGLKRDKYFYEQDEPIELDTIVVDHDGKAVSGKRVDVRAVLLDWAYEKGKYVTKERDPQDCRHDSEMKAKMCSFKTKEGGRYRITASVVDDRGRANQTELTVWVAGGKQPAARNVEQEEITLIPDKKEYRPGDTAEILVQSPFYPAEGVLSLRRSGIVTAERFSLTGPSKTVTVPINDVYTPNIFVQIDVVGAATRVDDKGEEMTKLPRRPAYAKGSLRLSVPPVSRTLSVKVKPRDKKLAPGGQTKLDITVRDAAGKGVSGAELAVVVVDEAVLSLSNYQLADPLGVFYRGRGAGARDYHLRASVKLARPELALLSGDATGGDADGVLSAEQAPMEEAEKAADVGAGSAPPAPPPPPGATRTRSAKKKRRKKKNGGSVLDEPNDAAIAVRSNFNALAVFSPEVRTDGDGRAVVDVKVPDNLTRYRVMVVAVAGDKQFGKGESAVIARMPLMVRPSAPRFLNFGDKFELPVVVQNQTDEAMTVEVAVRATNAALTQGLGRRVQVAANDRAEVRFPAEAEMAGTARFQVAAGSGQWADAAQFALPVWTPATTEAFATYGEIDKGAIKQPVALPGAVVKQFGGLEVTTSSTQLQALTDAFLYLVAYPFECAEQVSSRVLAVAALRDVLTAFQAQGLPPVKEIEAAMARDLDKLASLQNRDGGFAFWRRGKPSWPYISIHVANALARAKSKGFTVPDGMLDKSRDYLRNVERHIPGWYGEQARRTLIAYALHVRKSIGDGDPARARKLIAEAGLDKLPMDAIGWLLGVLSGDRKSRSELAQIHRYLQNKVTETAATAEFTTSYADGAHLILHSSRRADGIILESLIADKPRSDLIPKLVRGLLGHRKRGRWGNTQENAFVLLALDRYFNVYEKVTPNFVARVWLGDRFAGDHRFRGRTTERHHIDIPMRYLADLGSGDLTLQKDGKGRMYYRIGMTYAPASLKLEPADHGFAVERTYEAVDDPGDVTRLPDGTWKVKAGTRVRVRLTMVAESRRYHVALVDPLPAGLEVMNPALAVTGEIPQDPSQQQRGGYWWWYRTWYEHQNVRDERVEAFTSLLRSGVHEYTYVARATTPGRFVVPPSKAEEMYFPETFGRSASDVLIVE